MKKINLSTDHIDVFVSGETKVEGSFSITKDSLKEATSQKIALRILKNIKTSKQFVIDADLISFDDF
jgi:hypothetical protein